jgi:hypothetical protein
MRAFRESTFDGGERHKRRVGKINAVDRPD